MLKEKTYDVISPRVGLLYKVNPHISVYGAIATGANTPSIRNRP
ncbi:MAG: TonB-dependent receptor domain-containing protein [Aquificaceae bacterium]